MKRRMLAILLTAALCSGPGMSAIAADGTLASEDVQITESVNEAKEDVAAEEEEDVAAEEEPAAKSQTGQSGESETVVEQETVEESVPVYQTEDYTGWSDDGEQYYENGELVCECVKEIDGSFYLFDYEGYLVHDGEYGIWYDEEIGCLYYRTNEDGTLFSGWYVEEWGSKQYYDSNFVRATDVIFTVDGNNYYADEYGWILIDQDFVYQNVFYHADEDGILTEKETSQNGWQFIGGYYYYMDDGVIVTNEIRTIDGKRYYFNDYGRMETGAFEYEEVVSEDETIYGWKMAASDGQIVENVLGWYQSKTDDGSYWYYFEKYGWLCCDKFKNIGGKTYYFESNGVMATGLFWAYDSEIDDYRQYLADSSGAVVSQLKDGWIQPAGSSDWYYYKDGSFISDDFLDLGSKTYYFDYDGKMRSGKFTVWGEERACYCTDSSGAIIKNKWVMNGGYWHYAQADGKLYIDGKHIISGKYYIFDWQGELQVGVVYYEDGRFLTDNSGAVIEKKGWSRYGLEWYYVGADGQIVCDDWVEGNYYVNYYGKMLVGTHEIDGKYYYFNKSGYCDKKPLNEGTPGWSALIDGHYYYRDQNGEPYTGWVDESHTYYIENGVMQHDCTIYDEETDAYYLLQYDGKCVKNGWYRTYRSYDFYGEILAWVYAESDGKLVVDDWKEISSQKYYFEGNGYMVTGLYEIDGKEYLFGSNGALMGEADKIAEGWKKINGSWYYFNGDGTRQDTEGQREINGKTYYFGWNGRLLTNTVMTNDSGKAIYLDGNGYTRVPAKGWNKLFGSWYYVESNGEWAQGLKKINGKWYQFWEGRMETGCIYVDEWQKYAFFGESGALQNVTTGWYKAGGSWYYFKNGDPITPEGIQTINGKTYYIGWHGLMYTGCIDSYVFGNSGALLKNAWYYDGDTWVYADQNGRHVTGIRVINGKKYYFDEYGRWIK